jgi:erythromycin esterase
MNRILPLKSYAALEPLKEAIGDSKIVMLGEASHGTHEYYTWRSAISKILIEQMDFSFIAVEGDWPDCYRINNWVKSGEKNLTEIKEVLHAFNRWPTWMWANWEVAELAEWLRAYNMNRGYGLKIGFYGLDVYSLWESMNVMVEYLEKEDPKAAETVKKAISCFEPYEEEGQYYARAVSELSASCKKEVLDILKEIRSKAMHYDHDPEAAMNAEQNARIIVNAEKYYSSLIGFDNESWNIRDRHMMETLTHLLRSHGTKAKAIVWEHNTHIGDARYTDMKNVGMINIGQLAREEYGEKDVFLLGFGSYKGTVIAGRSWGAPMQRMHIPPAREGSIEHFMHEEYDANHMIIFDHSVKNDPFKNIYDHRAIGVVYNPEYEKYGNYVPSKVSSRYDAFIYLQETKALHPLHMMPDGSKMPETYPFGI